MIVYSFYERDETAHTQPIGDVTVDDFGQVRYSNRAIKELVLNTDSGIIKGQFNPDNPAHYMALPIIYSGSRLWANAQTVAQKARFKVGKQ